MKKIASALFAVVTVAGCQDGLICDPLDIFNCCDPSLDLSCDPFRFDGFFGARTATPTELEKLLLFQQTAPLTAPSTDGVSGIWNVSLQSSGGTCPGVPDSIDGIAEVTQVKRRVTVEIPRVGTYRGRLRRDGFSASGSYHRAGAFCRGSASVKFTDVQDSSAEVQASASIKCLGVRRCAAKFQGVATR